MDEGHMRGPDKIGQTLNVNTLNRVFTDEALYPFVLWK